MYLETSYYSLHVKGANVAKETTSSLCLHAGRISQFHRLHGLDQGWGNILGALVQTLFKFRRNQYVYKPTRCTKFLWIRLYFHYMLYMFRTVLVHHQEQLYKLYIAFGICRYVWLSCRYTKKSFRVPIGILKSKTRSWSIPQITINYCIIINKRYI